MLWLIILCSISVCANLLFLWPSYAGMFLLVIALLLGFLPLFEQYLINVAQRATSSTAPSADSVKTAVRSIRQVLVGVAIALTLIVFIEAYLTYWHMRLGINLAD